MHKMIAIAAVALAMLWATPACTTPGPNSPSHGSARAQKSFRTKPKPGTKAHCPVMGHTFTVSANTAWSKYKNRYYGFCCPGCKPKFDADPAKYAGR